MTPKEALNQIKETIVLEDEVSYTVDGLIYKEAHKLLETLVAKATPMKAKMFNKINVCCPICQKVFSHYDNYCYYCGQALDWSNDENK